MISMDKTYRQRNGRKFIVAGILTDDVDPGAAVIGWRENESGRMVAATRRIDGSNPGYPINEPSQDDLIEVVPDVVRWVNVYPLTEMAMVYKTREDAEFHSCGSRIAILKITTKNGGANGAEDVSVEVIPVGGP